MFEDGTVVVDNNNRVIKVRGTVASRGSNDSSPVWDSGVVWNSRPVWAIFDFKNQTYEVTIAVLYGIVAWYGIADRYGRYLILRIKLMK